MPFLATWVQLEILMLREINQKEKDKYHMIAFIRGIYNVAQMTLSTEQKQPPDMYNRLVVAKGEWHGLGVWGG